MSPALALILQEFTASTLPDRRIGVRWFSLRRLAAAAPGRRHRTGNWGSSRPLSRPGVVEFPRPRCICQRSRRSKSADPSREFGSIAAQLAPTAVTCPNVPELGQPSSCPWWGFWGPGGPPPLRGRVAPPRPIAWLASQSTEPSGALRLAGLGARNCPQPRDARGSALRVTVAGPADWTGVAVSDHAIASDARGTWPR